MKRKQTDENNILVKRFKHSVGDELYDKKLGQSSTGQILVDRLNQINYLNETNFLNKRLNDDESISIDNNQSDYFINKQVNSNDLFISLLENYKEDTSSFTKIERLSDILLKLHNLNIQFEVLLDTEYTSEICSSDISNFSSNDLKYLDELYLANSNLPTGKRFSFYIVHIRLEVIKNVKSSKQFYKKTYDSNGNLKPIKYNQIDKRLILESWLDPNNVVYLPNSINTSFDSISNVISHKNGSIDLKLEHEHNWLNCYKDEVINQNESGKLIVYIRWKK